MKRSWLRNKDLLWAIYLGPGRWAGRLAPLEWLRDGSRWLMPLAWAMTRKVQRRFRRELHRYPMLLQTPGGVEQLLRDHVANALQRALDDLLMARWPPSKVARSCQILGQEHLEAALAQGRGALLASGHFFANRLAKRALKEHGWPIMSVRHTTCDDPKMGVLGRKVLQQQYYRFLNQVIEDEVSISDPECTLKMLSRLRDGGIINLHIDAIFSQQTCQLPFLGTTRAFPVGFMRIVQLAKSPIVPMLCLGSSGGLVIELLPPVLVERRPKEEVLAQLVQILEAQVLRYPEQWEHTAWL